MTRYRTIVADPPWPMNSTPNFAGYAGSRRAGDTDTGRSAMPYSTMTVEDICALQVAAIAEPDAHLYVWTMNRHIEDVYDVARAWGFTPSKLLTWAKAPRGIGLGGTFCNSTEFVLFARRGSLAAKTRSDRDWWEWKRPYDSRGPINSAKPDGFLDTVEAVSPGPYLEMFARRQRLGWDTWGDEALAHVDLGGVA